MTKALLLEPREGVARRLRLSLRRRIDLKTITTLKAFEQSLDQWRPDILILDLSMPGISGLNLLKEVLSRHRDLPVLFLTVLKQSKMDLLQEWRAFQTVDFVRSPIEPAEVLHRMFRLIEIKEQLGALKTPDVRPLSRYLVSDLHNPRNGRIDAKKVSTLFGLSLAQIARILGASLSAVHKTPYAASLQPRLALLERVAVGLLHLTGSPEGLRIWFNAPNPDLDGLTPLTLLKEGKIEVVANLVEDALLGQPG